MCYCFLALKWPITVDALASREKNVAQLSASTSCLDTSENVCKEFECFNEQAYQYLLERLLATVFILFILKFYSGMFINPVYKLHDIL